MGDNELDFDDQIRLAAKNARDALGLDIKIKGVIQHLASTDYNPDRWSIHFRQSDGRYFRVTVDEHEVFTKYGSVDVETLTKEIIRLLQERDPNDFLSR